VEGLVIAADSRGVVGGHFIDGRRKLHVASTTQPVVFALTGTADFPEACPPGVAFIKWMTNPPYVFRASESVLTHLARNPTFVLTETGLYGTAMALSEAVSAFLERFPKKLNEYSGSDICTLLMCQTENRENTVCGSVGLSIDAEGAFVLSKLTLIRYRSSDDKALQLFGEGRYAEHVVLHGDGTKFMRAEDTSMWNSRRLVSDLSGLDGAHFASSIIEATARATLVAPLPSGGGVGGPVTAVLLTSTDVHTSYDGAQPAVAYS
jgi:hypothetical protein